MMKVTVHGTEACGRCKILKEKLTNAGIPFEAKDVNVNEMIEKGFTAIPLMELEDGTILDFTNAVKWINNNSNN